VSDEREKRIDELLTLLSRHCTNDEIQKILRDAKSLNGEVRISGANSEALVGNLRHALNLRAVSEEQLYGALVEAEESGHQLIYLYKPTSPGVKARCDDGEEIATSLFGKDWQKRGFPLYHLNPVGEAWSDFRISPLPRGGAEWTAKIYAGVYQRITISVREDGYDECIHRRKELTRDIYLIKWHHFGLLEIRVPQRDSKDLRDQAIAGLTKAFRDAFTLDVDFEAIDLKKAQRKIVEQIRQPGGSELFSLPSIDLQDGDNRVAKLMTRSTEESIMDDAGSSAFVSEFGTCVQISLVWHLKDAAHGGPRDLLTSVGKYGVNTVLIRSNANSKAVRYVVNQLRRLA
jgi:hypothetical protein